MQEQGGRNNKINMLHGMSKNNSKNFMYPSQLLVLLQG